jgi:endoglucanase
MRLTFSVPLLLFTLMLPAGIGGCYASAPQAQTQTVPSPSNATLSIAVSPIAQSSNAPTPTVDPTLLQQSWAAYRQRFIQADGRVIDWESDARSTSEGQAYAMLRSVMIDDPQTFERTLTWAETNLRRGNPSDTLWAWKWGQDAQKKWGILDRNFASDADVDAVTALILASRRWNRPDYLKLAQTKLQDLWALSVAPIGKQRYLLPGPRKAFQQPQMLVLNPSYFAPYAFRLFAQVDRAHDWLSLVDSSYQVLEQSAALSLVALPSDWLALDTETGQFQAVINAEPIVSRYGFDAYRVWWRLALDAAWFDEPRAKRYLQQHLGALQQRWRSQQTIPAQFDLRGKPTVTYEATSQYGALYAAFRLIDPQTAEALYQQKILPQYRQGLWDHESAYYTQNIVWLGLLPSTAVSASLLQPANVTQHPHP